MTYKKNNLDDYKALPIDTLVEHLKNLHYADSIDIINELDDINRIYIFNHLPLNYAIELFDKPELFGRELILEQLPPERSVEILQNMSADEATDVFQHMSDSTKKFLFVLLNPETRSEINKLTQYPESSAGSLMTTEFIAVPSNWPTKKVLQHIKEVESTRETVYAIYIIDEHNKKLLAAVSLRSIILADPESNILAAARNSEPITISPYTDREDVARLFRRHDLLAVAVVDEGQHVIGIVTVDDVLESITEETTKDAYKFGGLEHFEGAYLKKSFIDMIRTRGGWLAILFLGEMFTATAMQVFENEIEKAIVLSLFIPLIMSSGGNSGSQATSLIIRALALREINLRDWWRVAFREIPTGVALGAFLGLIAIVRILAWQYLGFYDYGPHYILIAITIAASLIGIVTFGSLSGSMLPFILKALRFDPASASAPFVATLVDVTGIVIYFSICSLFLKGTLL